MTLNPDKSEAILLVTRFQSGSEILLANYIKIIGVTLDKNLYMVGLLNYR